MIYITGDIHGDIDIHKLTTQNFPQQRTMTKDDYLIICGDFGLLWDDSPLNIIGCGGSLKNLLQHCGLMVIMKILIC